MTCDMKVIILAIHQILRVYLADWLIGGDNKCVSRDREKRRTRKKTFTEKKRFFKFEIEPRSQEWKARESYQNMPIPRALQQRAFYFLRY